MIEHRDVILKFGCPVETSEGPTRDDMDYLAVAVKDGPGGVVVGRGGSLMEGFWVRFALPTTSCELLTIAPDRFHELSGVPYYEEKLGLTDITWTLDISPGKQY